MVNRRSTPGPDSVWLTVAVAMACVLAGFPTTAMKDEQLYAIITDMLANDQTYAPVLTESIKLSAADVPTSVRHRFGDLDDVSPLYALFALVQPRQDHYSKKELDLGSLVLSTAITCRTFKHVAVHVALSSRLIKEENDTAKYVAAVRDLGQTLLHPMSLLFGTKVPYDQLLRLYNRLARIGTTEGEQEAEQQQQQKAELLRDMGDEFASLNNTVESSCKVHNVTEYINKLRIFDQGVTAAVDYRTIMDDIPLSEIATALDNNKKAVLDFARLMNNFETVNVPTLRVLIKSPDPPAVESAP